MHAEILFRQRRFFSFLFTLFHFISFALKNTKKKKKKKKNKKKKKKRKKKKKKKKKNSSLCKYQALIIFLKWRNRYNLQKIDINSVYISLKGTSTSTKK